MNDTTGAVLSTDQLCATTESTTPPTDERTTSVCAPPASPLPCHGDVHGAGAAPSSAQLNVSPAIGAVTSKPMLADRPVRCGAEVRCTPSDRYCGLVLYGP